jgi:hypothetical protein
MNLSDYSDFEAVLSRAKHYYGENVKLLQSTRKTKKYMIFDPNNNKFVHFGQMGYIDYTKYIQLYDIKIAREHRYRYLRRALKIKGNWKDNPYSPNYLSLLLLWDF